jgi:hypothetical protein
VGTGKRLLQRETKEQQRVARPGHVDTDYRWCYHVISNGTGGVMVRTQIQLTEEQARKVKKIAASRGVSMAEVIRDALEGAIRSYPGGASEQKRKRALEIIGKFRSGKRDVSRKHDAYLAEAWKK